MGAVFSKILKISEDLGAQSVIYYDKVSFDSTYPNPAGYDGSYLASMVRGLHDVRFGDIPTYKLIYDLATNRIHVYLWNGTEIPNGTNLSSLIVSCVATGGKY